MWNWRDQPDFERGLFLGLPDGRLLERFPVIDEAAGQGPARGRVLALDQDDAVFPPFILDFDDQIDRRGRIAIRLARVFGRA